MANSKQQQSQVVIVKHEHGCLVSLLLVVLFGWVGALWVACVWTLKTAWRVSTWALVTSWRWTVAYPVKYSWRACLWTWRGTRALIRATQARIQAR